MFIRVKIARLGNSQLLFAFISLCNILANLQFPRSMFFWYSCYAFHKTVFLMESNALLNFLSLLNRKKLGKDIGITRKTIQR